MNIRSVYSNNPSSELAVKEIKEQLSDFDSKVILYFTSSCYNFEKINLCMENYFCSSKIFGCSTSGEIISGKMLKNSIVAMAFNSNVIEDICIQVIENIQTDCDVKTAFTAFEKHFEVSMEKADTSKYFGIVLIDGLSFSEEKVMDKIGNLTNMLIVGGSAGDDLQFKRTYVYANGKYYSDAAILAIIKAKNSFGLIKTQSFRTLDKKLIATKVNSQTREVFEFNGMNAVQAYANALNINVEKASEYFMTNPIGLVIDKDIYVRSPQQIQNGKIVFYCNILEGMEVHLLQSTDIINDTKKAIKDKLNDMGSISGIINFHCILRTLELEQKKLTEEYGSIFSDIPTIGFSTYGEEYLGHINQTSTMLAFK